MLIQQLGFIGTNSVSYGRGKARDSLNLFKERFKFF